MPRSADTDEDSRCISARKHIKRLLVGDEARPRHRFVPVDKLRSYLTRDKVKSLLECRCSTCKKDHAAFKRDIKPTEFIGRIVGSENVANARRDPAKTALALFALLISIEHPLLIVGFVMRQCSDHNLETSPALFSADHLRTHYCKEFATRVGVDEFDEFVSDFAESLPKYAVPRMNSGEYSVYGPDTILPFINERKLGVRGEDGIIRQEGAHGKVYAFEIYEEYRQFPHAKEYTQFARKELDSSSELAFHLENKNLEQATNLRDPHIVKMIKAYRHGDTFNLVFPLAKTNLDHLLREPALDTSHTIQGPVESRAAWKQVLGVAKALGNIGGPNGVDALFGSSDKERFQGLHFDLKPANILIDDEGTWIISDFGESTFRETGRSSARVPHQGGTDAYAPPEIVNPDSRFSRRYDVWSLGCIMLEVLAFVILGYDGLLGEKGLDQARCTKTPWSYRKDHRFFCQESAQGKHIVKKEIMDFMKLLEASEPVRGQQRSRIFVQSILELITKMLEPEAEHRIDIGNVIRLLRSAMDNASEATQALGQMVEVDGEQSIGQPGLNSVRIFHLRQNEWQDASLRIFEDQSSNLRTCTVLKNNTSPSEDHLIRSMTMLIPRYAFRDRFTSDPAIYFSHITPDGPQQYSGLIFSFDDWKDAWFVQETLIGQKVEASFAIDSIKYKEYTSPLGRLSRLFHSKDEKEGNYTDLGAGRVQLWSEVVVQKEGEQVMARHDSVISTKRGSTRPVRMQPHQQPGYREVPLRRMVIFVHKLRKIILVTMNRNWHEDDKPKVSEQPKFLHLCPTKPTRDPSFVATTLRPLRPDDPTSFAGIPLSPTVLRSFEYQNHFECDSIGLTFQTAASKKKFSDTFKVLWKEWYNQTKAAERQPGYTPVPAPVRREHILPQAIHEPTSTSRFGLIWSQPSNILKPSGSSPSSKDEVNRPQPQLPHRGGNRGGSRGPLKNKEIIPQVPVNNIRYS